ncbi:hypothetical protein [Actinomadura fibrosa]|uniref:WXG100 family type VII secretion target n=1 Tax=Actinomadura fibrosa TaxID=111802 RepID=A0ABW2XZ15_9ACTN|nr:hypothetical protein [Actinomadura fibrosa]
MTDVLGAAKGLAEASMYECIWVSIVIPAAIPINQIVYQAQGDPKKIWDAADGWKETIDQLEKAQREVERLTRSVQESVWEGDDRTAYEKHMREYVQQLDGALAMAWAVAIALWVLAVMIAVFIYLMFLVVSLLAVFATAIVIVAGTIVGAPAALELEAEANQFATMAFQVLSIGSKALTVTFGSTALIFGGFLVGNLVQQGVHGNDRWWGDMKQATLNGLDDMMKGTLSYLEQRFTGRAMGSVPAGNWTGIPQASRMAPLSGIEQGALGLGAVDTRSGGPVLAQGGESLAGLIGLQGDDYGSGEPGGPDPGRKYVEKTQPQRDD